MKTTFQDSYESYSMYDSNVTEGLFSDDPEKIEFSLMVYVARLEKERKFHNYFGKKLLFVFSRESSDRILGYDEFQCLICSG